jgi:hypothetical protein
MPKVVHKAETIYRRYAIADAALTKLGAARLARLTTQRRRFGCGHMHQTRKGLTNIVTG